MFEKFFGKKEKSGEERAMEIIIGLGVLLDLQVSDREILDRGEKLDFYEDSKVLYDEGRKLLESGRLSTNDATRLKEVLDAIELNYKV